MYSFCLTITKGGEKSAINCRQVTKAGWNKISVHPKSTWKNSRLHQYPRIFIYYAKARSNVYIFALATMVSLILGTHANLDPIIIYKAVTAELVFWLLEPMFITT